jgi:hypothetical protein
LVRVPGRVCLVRVRVCGVQGTGHCVWRHCRLPKESRWEHRRCLVIVSAEAQVTPGARDTVCFAMHVVHSSFRGPYTLREVIKCRCFLVY